MNFIQQKLLDYVSNEQSLTGKVMQYVITFP